MDKLISLQNVIEILENKRFETGKDLAKSYLLADVQEQIERLPAAFDKEKVIEEIEESAKLYSLSDRDCEFAVPINVSLEIVEKGGVE
ncbi:Uncharacterised protein [Blautia hydrogenotrophica]|uniref:hypothetical protein n=1 Tax=Blautia hydrogenotrophica TaxID=53443 RepID=UPI0006BF0A42|nr:hypothetical protein [Blautia hydrogenotrophica]CUM74500.1 Uncharacterised protein [Blautia hydrogenotrophica]SCH64472.1 Uncharacterised protein [uncultured Blautia sp.]